MDIAFLIQAPPSHVVARHPARVRNVEIIIPTQMSVECLALASGIRSSAQVRLGKFDQLVAAAIQNGFQGI